MNIISIDELHEKIDTLGDNDFGFGCSFPW